MNTITRYVIVIVIAFTSILVKGQETKRDSILVKVELKMTEKSVEKLKEQKEAVQKQEKEFLKQDIKDINERLDKDEITAETAEKLKKEAAQKRAANIADKIAIIDKKIAILKRTGYKTYQAELPKSKEDLSYIRIGGRTDDSSESLIYIGSRRGDNPKRYARRTTEDLIFAIGFNNTIIEGQSIDDSPYELAGSGFVELGFAWTTRIFENNNFWRLQYGASLQWNKLDFKDNNYLVNTDGDISVQEFASELNQAKLRITNLVFPVHLEFGPSKKIEHKNYTRYSTYDKFKFGIGGYAGFNIGSLQKLKYKENGNRIKDKQKGGFEVSDFVYGLSSYVSFGGVALYVKYDLNPLFKNQEVDQNNISVGLRFDI